MHRIAIFCLLGSMLSATSYGQSSATVKMDHGEVSGSERTVTISVVLDEPSPCTTDAQMTMTVPNTPSHPGALQVPFQGPVKAGEKNITLTAKVPKDYYGDFHAQNGILYPCEGYSYPKPFSTDALELNVLALPDTKTYPEKAAVALSLTQKQFLTTKAAELDDLATQIDARVEQDGSDTDNLRRFLVVIVNKAETDLRSTERQYKTEILKPTEALPAFFEDFNRQYQHLLEELNAPIPGTSASLEPYPQLLYVQDTLKRRPPSSPHPPGRNLSGTSPGSARNVKASVKDNSSAYKIVNATGEAKFHIKLGSQPPGATVKYRQVILPDYTDLSRKTNMADEEFSLATSVFKFHKDSCEDEPVVTIDPYNDREPDITVEFKRCHK